ncbi:unnamed protein product [Nesidiocoris tenuis]|uniref:Uncharacterized protein n=1 Tax=Nesidiocoris tenuis TaxID=355587 RepID=A0A6H5GBE0_9HEMI|nr:unnamed protein product [Nesidiocoris tenuis]
MPRGRPTQIRGERMKTFGAAAVTAKLCSIAIQKTRRSIEFFMGAQQHEQQEQDDFSSSYIPVFEFLERVIQGVETMAIFDADFYRGHRSNGVRFARDGWKSGN